MTTSPPSIDPTPLSLLSTTPPATLLSVEAPNAAQLFPSPNQPATMLSAALPSILPTAWSTPQTVIATLFVVVLLSTAIALMKLRAHMQEHHAKITTRNSVGYSASIADPNAPISPRPKSPRLLLPMNSPGPVQAHQKQNNKQHVPHSKPQYYNLASPVSVTDPVDTAYYQLPRYVQPVSQGSGKSNESATLYELSSKSLMMQQQHNTFTNNNNNNINNSNHNNSANCVLNKDENNTNSTIIFQNMTKQGTSPQAQSKRLPAQQHATTTSPRPSPVDKTNTTLVASQLD